MAFRQRKEKERRRVNGQGLLLWLLLPSPWLPAVVDSWENIDPLQWRNRGATWCPCKDFEGLLPLPKPAMSLQLHTETTWQQFALRAATPLDLDNVGIGARGDESRDGDPLL